MQVKSSSWYDGDVAWSGLMNYLEKFLACSTLSFEVALCGFVFARKVQRILPLFAAYSSVVFAGTICTLLSYDYFGFNSPTSYYAYWGSLLLNAAARSFAIAELCRYGLRAYLGICALAWRVLAALSVLLFARAAIDSWGQPTKTAIYSA